MFLGGHIHEVPIILQSIFWIYFCHLRTVAKLGKQIPHLYLPYSESQYIFEMDFVSLVSTVSAVLNMAKINLNMP